jgi:hypothetical protein
MAAILLALDATGDTALFVQSFSLSLFQEKEELLASRGAVFVGGADEWN